MPERSLPSLLVQSYAWVLRALWVALPFTFGPLLGAALGPHSVPLARTATVLAWAVWGAGLVATLVFHPIGLVGLRAASPVLAVAAIWSAVTGEASTPVTAAGLVVALLVALLVQHSELGFLCVNGPAYPNERRFLLRPPATLLLGPIPLAGILLGASFVVGPLLLAARAWVPGAIAGIAGGLLVWVLSRALHAVTDRFLVFVPAGLVLHDETVLREPVLFRTQVIERIQAAPADTDSLDLTANAPGLAIEVVLTEKVEITRVFGRGLDAEVGRTARFLAVPTLPGRFVATAIEHAAGRLGR